MDCSQVDARTRVHLSFFYNARHCEMGRKSSLYSRKRRGRRIIVNEFSWANVLNDSSSYEEGAIASLGIKLEQTSAELADGILLKLRAMFDALCSGDLPWQDSEAYDIVMNSLAIGLIRSIAIAGDTRDHNPMIRIFREAESSLAASGVRRMEKYEWLLTHDEIDSIRLAIDQYSHIFSVSSPSQMQAAFLTRADDLDKQFPGEGIARLSRLFLTLPA